MSENFLSTEILMTKTKLICQMFLATNWNENLIFIHLDWEETFLQLKKCLNIKDEVESTCLKCFISEERLKSE